MKPDLPTGPTDKYYIGTHDDPAQSPSLAPGQVLPDYRWPAGLRVATSKPLNKRQSGKKGSRASRTSHALLAHATQFPHLHPRQYVMNERHMVVPIPAPTPAQLALSDRDCDEFGVIRTFVVVDTPYHPVVTVTQESPELISSHFGVTGKLTSNCYQRTIV